MWQHTNTSCGPTSLAILLSYYGIKVSSWSIAEEIPRLTDDKGEDWGTFAQRLAMYCINHDLKVSIFTFDFQVIDLKWEKLSQSKLLARMELAKKTRDIPSLGKELSEIYMQSFIDFIKAGGKLHINKYVTSTLLYKLLEKGPVMVSVCSSVLYNTGRTTSIGLRQSKPDDINGTVSNHFLVVYGNTEDGKLLIDDPYFKPGLHTIEPERLMVAMTAAQIECDNMWIQIDSV